MPSKSKRKRKYAGPRRPLAPAAASTQGVGASAAQPASTLMPKEPPVRSKPLASRSPAASPPAPTNMGREVRTIGVMAGLAVIVIVVLSLVLR